jgi:hypothetical protein
VDADDVVPFLRAQFGEDDDSLLARAVASVPWLEYPLPPRWHRCRTVQSACIDGGALYERCACGSIRRNAGPWTGRNSRRRRMPFPKWFRPWMAAPLAFLVVQGVFWTWFALAVKR